MSAGDGMNGYMLELYNVRKLFPVARGIISTLLRKPLRWVHAVDDVSFQMKPGEILSLVGESGSGKTTTALCCTGLIPASDGEILLDGENVLDLVNDRKRRKKLRLSTQVIFQDPYESLNPRQTVFNTVAEPLEVHNLVNSQTEKVERVTAALEDAGLKPPAGFFDRYPQELSGGQRQRVVIASALVMKPKLLVADEPVSMLDVSIRADILNLLRKLRDDHGITILYITHDLATAAFIADRVVVMYLGNIVEIGPAKTVLGNPFHPYTRALMSVIPVPNPRRRHKRMLLTGETPNPIDLPTGCRFHPRCPELEEECRQMVPVSDEIEPDHFVACGLPRREAAAAGANGGTDPYVEPPVVHGRRG
jgi:peptide/nickel transport system ATP-binding protein